MKTPKAKKQTCFMECPSMQSMLPSSEAAREAIADRMLKRGFWEDTAVCLRVASYTSRVQKGAAWKTQPYSEEGFLGGLNPYRSL